MNQKIIFVTILLAAALIDTTEAACGATADGVTYDFSSLTRTDTGYKVAGASGDDNYFFNVCSDVSNKPPTCGSDAEAFQVASNNYCTVVGKSDSPQWTAEKDKVTVVYGGGDPCTNNARSLKIEFICDESAGKGTPAPVNEIPVGSCQYDTQWKTALACASHKGGGGGPGAGGLSAGWWIIIILAIVTTVYCAGGITYKVKKQGMPFGKEAIPNVDFWADLPALVKEGVQFTIAKARGGSSSYEKV